MKRCPECEFIYEEDQLVCDLDGAPLIHDPLALVESPTKQDLIATRRHSLLQFGLPAFFLLLLAGWAVLNQIHEPPAAAIPPQMEDVALTATPAFPVVEGTVNADGNELRQDDIVAGIPSEAKETSSPIKSRGARSSKRVPAKLQRSDQTVRPSQRSSDQVSTSTEPTKKNENRIGSFFKKTGRLLKKPFKL